MRLVALLLVASCGGAPKSTPVAPHPDPIPKTAGPSCKAVAAHLATLADRDPTKEAAPDVAMRNRCETDAWSDDARSCFATAQAEPEVDGCKSMLTDLQRKSFGEDAKPAPAAPAAAAAPPPPPAGEQHRSRAPVKKSKTGDPCEGGQ
jgi:hypothetical protein